MLKSRIILLAIVWLALASFPGPGAKAAPTSGLYQIISGTYVECCGFAGGFRTTLPSANQSFVRLTIDKELATMTFFGSDTLTIFSVLPCPPGDPINFSFNYGFIRSNTIVFHVDPGPPPYSEFWNLGVTNSADALRIDGTVGISAPSCSDVPTRFSYSNVVAVMMPVAGIRMSEVEICWNAVSNRNYQVQYRSALTTHVWTNLGAPVSGNGSTNCITDKVPVGAPQRFYRVLAIP